MTAAASPPRSRSARIAEAARQLAAWQALVAEVPAETVKDDAEVSLTIGVATYDDFDGAWFTLASALLHHPELVGKTEFLVIDNHPTSPASRDLADFVSALPGGRYVPFRGFRGTAARDLVCREARGEVVCCLDAHVLVRPGGFAALLDYFAERPASRDLVQGPLLAADLTSVRGTHFEPIWARGLFGVWGNNGLAADPGGQPYDLEAQGLGLFACRREAWVGLHPGFRGFGGEEGYLHEKVRRQGGRTVGLPALGWAHRFERPGGIPYPNLFLERIRNYELGWAELGWDLGEGRRHWRSLGVPDEVFEVARRAPNNPAAGVDGVLVTSPRPDPAAWARVVAAAATIDLDWRLERMPVSEGGDAAGRFDTVMGEARRRGWRTVLVIAEEARLGSAETALREAVAALSTGAPQTVVEVEPAGSAMILTVPTVLGEVRLGE